MGDEKKILTEFFELEQAEPDVHKLRERSRKEYENEDATYLTGLMAVAGEENGNGRIYPKDVLQREVENYKKLIRENRALGECVEEGSKILTDEGWKDFRELSGDEYIQTLNTDTEEIEYQKVSRVVAKEPEEDALIRFKNRNIDIKVTPGHRFYLIDRYGEGKFVEAKEILENRGKYSKCYIPKRASWNKEETNTNGIYLDERYMDVERAQYQKEKVYCVTVPNSTFYCMSPEGHCFWSANCDHPDSSVVSLEDASHMITRIWWDGPRQVKGNVKVLDTEAGQNVQALLDGGVKLGISSRGLGSVREEQGSLVVEDDFQLIAFDFVSDPSTTGAFMLQENQNPQNSEHFKQEDKVNRILNDIVT